jgi:ribosome maturation factor RimP
VSHEVSAVLDVADAIPHAYRLEVSSPGLDRPLRREADFRRFGGRTVKLRTHDPVEGRRNFLGTLLDAHDGVVRIECDGRTYQVPVAGLVKANLVPDWKAEFKKAERSAS